MALIVVVASQVCAHVQTPQFMYIKYVLFCAYHITPQDVFLNMQIPHPVANTTHKPYTLTHKKSPLHILRIMCDLTQHTNNIKRSNMHTAT